MCCIALFAASQRCFRGETGAPPKGSQPPECRSLSSQLNLAEGHGQRITFLLSDFVPETERSVVGVRPSERELSAALAFRSSAAAAFLCDPDDDSCSPCWFGEAEGCLGAAPLGDLLAESTRFCFLPDRSLCSGDSRATNVLFRGSDTWNALVVVGIAFESPGERDSALTIFLSALAGTRAGNGRLVKSRGFTAERARLSSFAS